MRPPRLAGEAGAPSESPIASPAPTAVVDVPIVSSTPEPVRAAVAPVRVQISAAGVDMPVIPVGIEPGGFMELPADPAIGGWYRFGPDPWSADGNTVIAAHIDSPDYPIGPFANLRDVPADAEVVVTGADGSVAAYGVVSVTYYPKQELPTQELFARQGTKALVLITCGGAFDSSTGHYADNVVVVAVAASVDGRSAQAASPTNTAAASSAASASRSSRPARARRPNAMTATATMTDAAANRYGTVGPYRCHSSAAIGGAAAPPRKRTAEYDDDATERGQIGRLHHRLGEHGVEHAEHQAADDDARDESGRTLDEDAGRDQVEREQRQDQQQNGGARHPSRHDRAPPRRW